MHHQVGISQRPVVVVLGEHAFENFFRHLSRLDHIVNVLNDLVVDLDHLVFQFVKLCCLGWEVALEVAKALLLLALAAIELGELLCVVLADVRRLYYLVRVFRVLAVSLRLEADWLPSLQLDCSVMQSLDFL